MATRLFGKDILKDTGQALDFIGSILESSTEYSIIGKDLDGTILLWNEGARRIYGYEAEEVIGKANSSILHTREDVEAGKPRQILKSALRDNKWEGTVARVKKNGQRFMARVVITPRYDSGGSAVGFLLISKDISEEMRLSQELEATQFYTRSLIESNIDALMTTDSRGAITDVNEQMESLTGHRREELIGTPFKLYFTDPRRAEDGIRLVLARGKVTNYELTARGKDGRETVVSYNASTFHDSQGRLQGVFAAARDITEQKKLEQQLRDSEAYNRGLIEASVDGLITVDPGGTIMDVNEQMCRMSGYRREELIGTRFAGYFVDSKAATAGVNETFEKGVVTDYVLTLARQDRRRLKVSFNASVFRDPAGNVRGIFASARDITEQARLQSQLAAERAYNRGLIEASLDPMVTISPGGKITDVNRATELATGVGRERLIGSSFSDYFTEPQKAEAGYQKVLAEGLVQDYPLTIRHVSGRTTDVLYNATVYRNEAGEVQGVFAAARDVTERKRMEEELRAASLYARSLIEASLDPLVTISPEGKVTDVNRATELVTGAPRERLIGSSFSSYFTEPSKAEAGYQKVLAEGLVRDYPLTIRHVSGHTTDVLYNATVYRDEAGHVQGVFAGARDVTERKRVEAELVRYREHLEELVRQRTSELEAANTYLQKEIVERQRASETLQRMTAELARSNQELEQFAYVASHDLQEPLRAVTGYLGLLEQRYGSKLDEQARHHIAGATQGATRMHTLITGLLALSRVGTRGQVFEAADFNAVVDQALESLGASVRETGAKITRDPLPTLRADTGQMAQLFQNLVGNALKFRGERVPEIHIGAERQGNQWVFSVRDNGIGMEPQYFERIFLVFQRLHTRKEYPGTGIGLAICKKIVERNGGAIWVESRPGEGSTFYFTVHCEDSRG